nr:MAG TPA: protein of unknown function (DUF4376) [Caudoviricetes sp.]
MIKTEFGKYIKITPELGKILLLNNEKVNEVLLRGDDTKTLASITEVDDATYVPPEEEPGETIDPLATLKKNQVALSKKNLAKYLEEHPLLSNCKYEEGRYYNVTAEKQQQLTSKVLMATMYAQAGMPYNLTWNDTGDICESWELSQLQQLSMEIDAYVTPLVSLQQTMEVTINDCVTQEEVLAVNVEYTDEQVKKWLETHTL